MCQIDQLVIEVVSVSLVLCVSSIPKGAHKTMSPNPRFKLGCPHQPTHTHKTGVQIGTLAPLEPHTLLQATTDDDSIDAGREIHGCVRLLLFAEKFHH